MKDYARFSLVREWWWFETHLLEALVELGTLSALVFMQNTGEGQC